MSIVNPSQFRSLRSRLSENQKQGLRFFIIAAVLLLNVGLYFVVPEDQLSTVLMAPFAIVGLLALLRWPALGIFIVMLGGILTDIELIPMGIVAMLLGAVLGLWIVDMVIQKKKITLIASPIIYPLILFTLIVVLAFLVGQFPWYPTAAAPLNAQVAGVFIFILSFGAFLFVAHQFRSIRWLKVLTYLFVGIAIVVVLISVSPEIERILWPIVRLHISLRGGSQFWMWLVAIVASQLFFNRHLKWYWRLLFALLLVITFYIRLIEGRHWTSGWLPALIALFVVVWVGAPRWTIPIVLVGALFLLNNFDELYANFILVGDNEYSTITRLEAWRIVWEIAQVNPILGLGPANYHYYTPLFPILGWYVRFNSHNNYVDIVAQTGFLGLFCYIWFFWLMLRILLRLRQMTPAGGFTRAYVYGAIGGLAGMIVAGMLGDWVLPFVYNVSLEGMRASILGWVFLGGALALEKILLSSGGVDDAQTPGAAKAAVSSNTVKD